MMLDAGALVAVDRDDRAMIARLLAAQEEDDELRTHPLIVAQVWRDRRGRQATLARVLRSVKIIPIGADLGRRCGELLARAKTSDPIDAAVVLIAEEQELVLTSDPDDLRHLARCAKRSLHVIPC